MNYSQSQFKIVAKFDSNPYPSETGAIKLNHLLQQLEIYFSIHHIEKK